MIVLKIESVKEFMAVLFGGDLFDRFHVTGCEVTTFAAFKTDGRLHEEGLDTDERQPDASGLVLWRQIKPHIYSLIRGKKKPLKMLIDFCHYMPNGDAGSLRIQFEKDELHLYTGYMQKEFSLDKSAQEKWDENCEAFIRKNKIVSTQLE